MVADDDTNTNSKVAMNAFDRSETSLTPLKDDEHRTRVGKDDLQSTEGASQGSSTGTFPACLSVNPGRVQAAALFSAAFLGLVKLGADAHLFKELRILRQHYYDLVGVWCLDCTVPDYVVQSGPDEVMKWNVALEREEVIMRLWHPFTSVNLAYSTLVLLYILTQCAHHRAG